MIFQPKLRFMPEGRGGGGILPGVIAVMVYLSVMAVAVGFSAHNAASGWSAELNGTATLQIVSANAGERTHQTELALNLLRRTPGVQSARKLTNLELVGLLEPWLGSGNVTADLPVPAMISIVLNDGANIDLTALEIQLRQVAPDARLDDQQGWINELSRLADTIQLAAMVAVLMILGATVAIVIFATQAKLDAHREHVELVHIMGAEDKVIAGEMQYQFLIYGLKGGLFGFGIGAITLIAINYLGQQIGDGLVPQMVLNLPQIAALIAVPLTVIGLTTATARVATMRALTKLV